MPLATGSSCNFSALETAAEIIDAINKAFEIKRVTKKEIKQNL